MGKKGTIWLITGVPGVGKSSVSKALLGRFEFGFYVPIDDLREWVVSGLAHPVPVWSEETGRQFGLARRSAAEMARIYADEGFEVAIDDVLLPGEGELFAGRLEGYTVRRVFLWADLGVNQGRNRDRVGKNFDTLELVGLIDRLHEMMLPEEYEEEGWRVVDSSGLGVEETVDRVIEDR